MRLATRKRETGLGIRILAALVMVSLAGYQRSHAEQSETATPAPVAPSAARGIEVASHPVPGASLGIPSIPNLRDLGGYTAADGSVVVRGVVYRANQLSGIAPADMHRLASLGLRTAYDLRTAEEKDKRPDELPPGVKYVWLNVLADSPQAGPAQLESLMSNPDLANRELGGGKVEAKFIQSYREFVSLPSAQTEFSRLYLGLLQKQRVPAVFHCTTGKDRTGWAAAALLTLLGVPKDQVYADYLRSNDNILTAYQPAIDAFVAAGGEVEIPRAILGVKSEYLDSAFEEMQTRYGTIGDYFAKALGIDAGQQAALRAMYLEHPEEAPAIN